MTQCYLLKLQILPLNIFVRELQRLWTVCTSLGKSFIHMSVTVLIVDVSLWLYRFFRNVKRTLTVFAEECNSVEPCSVSTTRRYDVRPTSKQVLEAYQCSEGLRALIPPWLLYGSETWAVKMKDWTRRETLWMKVFKGLWRITVKYCDMTPESRSKTSVAEQRLGKHVPVRKHSGE
jgi:hypothetical protein